MIILILVLIKTAVKGNAAYIGPAAKAANSITKATPSIPESSPIYFIIDFVGVIAMGYLVDYFMKKEDKEALYNENI